MNTSNNIKVVSLGFNQNHYGICKNFIDAHINVIGATKNNNYLKTSRLPQHYIKHSDDIGSGKFLDQLIRIGKKKPKHFFLVPGTDTEIAFLIKYQKELSPYFFISAPKKDVFEVVTDKFLIQNLLIKENLNYPKTILIESDPVSFKNTPDIDFPFILKPAFAGDWKSPLSSKIIGEFKVIVINSFEELRSTWRSVSQINTRVIAQSIIEPAEGENYSFCSYSDHNGKVLHGFVTQKLVQYPEGFGTALLCQTIDNPEVYEFGKKTIESLGVDGICETEIIRDDQTKELFVIEVNTRHWMQHRLSTRLGVNYSLLDFYYRTGDEANVQMILHSNKGKFQNVVWFDEVGYLIYILKNGFHPGKCKLKEVLKNKWEFSLFSLNDWRPFISSVWKKITK